MAASVPGVDFGNALLSFKQSSLDEGVDSTEMHEMNLKSVEKNLQMKSAKKYKAFPLPRLFCHLIKSNQWSIINAAF